MGLLDQIFGTDFDFQKGRNKFVAEDFKIDGLNLRADKFSSYEGCS